MKQYTKTKVHTSSRDLVEKGARGFLNLARAHSESGRKISEETQLGYVAGFYIGIKALGLDEKHCDSISTTLNEVIDEMVKEGCGDCDICRGLGRKETKEVPA